MSERGREWVAVILAIGIVASIVALGVAAAIAEASSNLALSEPTATLLSTTLGAIVGAVATYLGTRPSDTSDGTIDYSEEEEQ